MQTIATGRRAMRRLGLGADEGVVLAMVGAALGMADDHVAGADIGSISAEISPVWAPLSAGMAVLAADGDRRAERCRGWLTGSWPAGRSGCRGPAPISPAASAIACSSVSWRRRPFIFQFPAISGRRCHPLSPPQRAFASRCPTFLPAGSRARRLASHLAGNQLSLLLACQGRCFLIRPNSKDDRGPRAEPCRADGR